MVYEIAKNSEYELGELSDIKKIKIADFNSPKSVAIHREERPQGTRLAYEANGGIIVVLWRGNGRKIEIPVRGKLDNRVRLESLTFDVHDGLDKLRATDKKGDSVEFNI